MKKIIIGFAIAVFLSSLYTGCASQMSRNNPFDPDNVVVGGGSGGGGGTSSDTYTKLMLHFDGANGSSVFTDASPSNKTVTGVNNGAGLPTISTTRARFGGSSLYIPGTGVSGNDGWVSVAASQDFNPGSGDFTIDCWVYCADIVDQGTVFGYQSDYILSMYIGSGSSVTIKRNLGLNVSSSGSSWNIDNTHDTNRQGNILIANAWNHVALVRNGNTWTEYVNGTLYYSFSSSASLAAVSGTNAFNIGRWGGHGLNCLTSGYIDEFRFSKGIARWTANFTPPTAAYN